MDDYDDAAALAAQFEDRLSMAGTGRGGGSSSRGEGGGKGGGANRAVDISRALSRLLRHQAASAGIPLDAEGYARLDQVLQWGPLRSQRVTVAEVQAVVADNEKQRFAMRRTGDVDAGADQAASWMIRANQGHSIALASDSGLLTPIADPDAAPAVVCHGTYFAAWPAIEAAGGLRPMGRNHVHCGCREDRIDTSTSLDPSRLPIPGLRKTAELLVFLDVRRALRERPGSLRWWRSANEVVLSEGDADAGGVVPTRYFERVVTTERGTALVAEEQGGDSSKQPLVLWRDGEKVADLPAGVLAKARMPPGQAGQTARRGRGGKRGGGKSRDEAKDTPADA